MAGSLGAIVISLEANMAKFVEGLDKATYQAEQSSRRTQKAFDGIRSSLTGLLELAGGAYVLNRIWEGFKGITQADLDLEHLAQRLGITAGQLSEMQYAAKRSGVDLETFNSSITRLEKNISGAALANEQATTTIMDVGESTNKAATAFRELGLKVEILRTMSPKDQLMAITKAMDNVPLAADKVRIGFDIMGRGSANMITMMRQGPEIIQGYIDRGRQLGVVLGDDMVARGAAAARALNELGAAGQGLKITLTDLLAPGITQVVNGLTAKIVAARESGAATEFRARQCMGWRPLSMNQPYGPCGTALLVIALGGFMGRPPGPRWASPGSTSPCGNWRSYCKTPRWRCFWGPRPAPAWGPGAWWPGGCDYLRTRAQGRHLTVGNLLFPPMLIVLAISRSFPLTLACLLVLGFGLIVQNSMTNTLLQTSSPDALRGRVMGLYNLTFQGMTPFGSLQVGIMANALGAPIAVGFGGLVCLSRALWLLLRHPELRNLP